MDFFELNSTNVRLNQCERPQRYQKSLKKIGLKGSGASYKQNKFPETITLETNSSFYMKQCSMEKG